MLKSQRIALSLTMLAVFFSSPVVAGFEHRTNYKDDYLPDCEDNTCNPFHFVGVITGGAAYAQLGKTMTFSDDDSIYSYVTDTSTRGRLLWGLALGAEYQLYPEIAAQAVLAYYQTGTYVVKGEVTQGVDSTNFETYPYQYNITSRRYMIEGKILGSISANIHPYLSVGLGASFNEVNGYEVDLPASPLTFSPKFDDELNINFAYSIGIGIDVDVTKIVRLGLGYRYAGLGEANLGEAMINTVPIEETLGQENLHAKEIFAQLTILI